MTGGKLILGAMLEAASQGDWATVDRLEEIAQDPTEVGRLIAYAADRTSHAEGGPAPKAETFSDDDAPPDVKIAVAGEDGQAALHLTKAAMDEGRAVLESVSRLAVRRRLNGGTGPFFTKDELATLADALASTNATAELLGRYRIRERFESQDGPQRFAAFADDDGPPRVKPIPPAEALKYFRELMPSLGDDPGFDERHRRTAFTLAENTGEVMLRAVQEAITKALATGKGGRPDVQDILDAAGVSTKNPDYGSMVFRTNASDAFNAGSDMERQSPDVIEEFPVFEYLIVGDSRTGNDHRPKGGKFYPASATFAEVRGERPFNCRCGSRAVNRREWARRQAQGATVETNW